MSSSAVQSNTPDNAGQKLVESLDKLQTIQHLKQMPIVADTASDVHATALHVYSRVEGSGLVQQANQIAHRFGPIVLSIAFWVYTIVEPITNLVDRIIAAYILEPVERIFPIVKQSRAEAWDQIVRLARLPISIAVLARDRAIEQFQSKRESVAGLVSWLNNTINHYFNTVAETAKNTSQAASNRLSEQTSAVSTGADAGN